jgi:hypothetical protein
VTGILAISVFAAMPLDAQPAHAAEAQSAPASVKPSTPPALTGGIFSLDQVHRGLHAVAYTVFEGTQPEAMDVEILGLLHSALGPGKDLILARLQGSKPEYTGVVAGMSGSPVYVDGKLLGALSYRIGQFSKEPIAGITPIEQMLEVRDQPQQLNLLADARAPGEDNNSATSTAGIQPIETPLVLSGFSPSAVELWQQKLSGLGLAAVSGIGGASQNLTAGKSPDNSPLLPGSAVSAILVRGDFEIAATCTVTYIDPKQLLACGHPITQFGAVSFPMTRADVLATLASPLNAFKIINTTDTIGTFTDDRGSAIRGVFGQQAPMIPITVALSGAVKARTLHFEVINQPQITPAAVLVSFYQALLEDNGADANSTYHVKGSIHLDRPTRVGAVKPNAVISDTVIPDDATIDTWVAPTDNLPASLQAALQIGERFSRLYSNITRVGRIVGVDLTVEATSERRQLQIESARVPDLNVHAGEDVTIEASLRPWHGELRNIRIPIHLPATLPSGSIRMLVSDGPTLDRITQPVRTSARPLDINATIAQINSLHNNDSIYVTLLRPEAQAAVDGRTLPSVPPSMANAFEPLRNAQEITLSGESVTPVTSVSMNTSLIGQQVIALHVE